MLALLTALINSDKNQTETYSLVNGLLLFYWSPHQQNAVACTHFISNLNVDDPLHN